MDTLRLGKTDLRVSKVCLGCMSFGSNSWRPWVLEDNDSRPLLKLALDNGINFFDTANVYSGGGSEEVLGAFIKDQAQRHDVIVSTKVFYPSPESPDRLGLTRENVLESIDGSLKRLQMDYIDIYQVHRWDALVSIDETMDALNQVVKSGKARHVGASNMRCWHLASAQLAAKDQGWSGFSTMQNHYNLLHREDERDLIPFCHDHGIGLMPWSPLARGRIARAGKDHAVTARAGDDAQVAEMLYGSADDPILDDVATTAVDKSVSAAQVGLAWLMHKGAVPVVGATKSSHIEDAISASHLTLNENEIERLESSYSVRPISELPWAPGQKEDPRLSD